ncbi:hypothetical protein PB2503_11179 [Parvularcula bermudensis HTCC2503]|uniref:Uncharacterized protein n=1 Tax=Parvularcula bermudensis (strain ATCC BAA-594 / HTCC2503 / KCTC 12087) TaxID=314260 RepID=E0TIG4_PARBH|nr:hypothetical protein [Parvularcula bermudensis]ADM10283.1 hypothetical protein PB2503_11179 [Parvularcula bermudensis HTCC2503]
MRQWYPLFIALLTFLGAQIAASAHAVEFGDPAHTHDGEACDLSQFGLRVGDLPAPPTITLPGEAFIAAPLAFARRLLAASTLHDHPPQRAPPFPITQ